MKHLLLSSLCLLAALVSVAGTATGVRIEKNITEPGTLDREVGAETGATGLVVTGVINVLDLDFISSAMRSLDNLDLSGARIEPWEGTRHLTPRSTFAANELPPLSLAGCMARTIALPTTLAVIGEGALAGAAMESLEIPGTVTHIGDGAFAGAPNLRQLTVPATVATAGMGVCRGCPALTVINYEARAVPDYAFAECASLREVNFGRAITSVGKSAFQGDASLSKVNFIAGAMSLTSIGDHAFHGTSITRIDLGKHSGLTSIGSWAFADCHALQSVVLPANVTTIGDAAFFNASELSDYSGANLPKIGDAMFKGALQLDIHDIAGNSAEEIGRYAFYGMRSLGSVHLPDRLSHIGDHAFDGCRSLSSMNAPAIACVPTLGEDVWGNLDKRAIFLGVPADKIEAFSSTPVWREFRIGKAGYTNLSAEMAIDDGMPCVTASFDGSVLTVESSAEMDMLMIYDLAGLMLYQSRPGCNRATVETSAWDNRIFIIRIITNDGHEAAVKTAR